MPALLLAAPPVEDVRSTCAAAAAVRAVGAAGAAAAAAVPVLLLVTARAAPVPATVPATPVDCEA